MASSVKDNVLELEGVVIKLNNALDTNIKKLNDGAVAVDNYNKKFSFIPSEFKKSLSEVKEKTDSVTKASKELTAVEKERIRVANELERVDAKIKVRNDQNTIALTNQKSVLKAINGAYAELSEKVKRASDNYQNIIVRGRTAEQSQRQYNKELRNAQKEFQVLQEKVLKADKAVDKWNRTGERSIGFMRDLVGAFGISMGVQLFVDLGREILRVTKELQSLDLALKQVAENQGEYQKQFFFLQRVAKQWGVELNGLTRQFTQFYVSAKDKISGNQIQSIFESITKAGALMGLSTQQQERAFLALNQMMSKGTIQAEELRGQLGEALPGAFGIMAKAMGVSEKELGKLMKDGKVLANEVLPKFAKELEKAYNIVNVNKVDTLTSAQNRLTNAWVEFIRELESGDGVLSRVSRRLTEGFAIGIQNLTNYMKSDATKRKEHYSEIREQARKTAEEFINSKDSEEKKLNLATKGIERYKKKLNETYLKAKELEGKQKDLLKSTDPNVRDQNGRGFRGYWQKVFQEQGKDLELLNVKMNRYRGMIDGLNSVLTKTSNTDDDDVKTKREKLKLTFDEVESEYNLKLAILERQKAQMNDRASNEDSLFEDRIKARKEFSDKSIEIFELEVKKEKDLINEKYLDDLDKNNLAYKNKDISSEQWSKNIQDIQKRTTNELATIDMNYSLQWNDLLNENAKFYKDIQDKNLEYTEQTNKLILDGEKAKYEKISNDSKKTLNLRQKAFEQYIELSKKELQVQKLKDIANAKSNEEIILISQKYADAIAKLNEQSTKESPFKKATEATEEYISKLASGQIEKSLESIGLSSAKLFLDFDANGQSTFDKLLEGADKFSEKFAITFQAVGDVAQDVFNKISELSNQRFEQEYNRLAQETEIRKAFAGDSAEAIDEIERQSEEKRKAIARREFQAKKKQALFNIAIDTAQAVMAQLARTPLPLGSGFVLTILGLGALQAGVVASQEMPQFWRGTDNAPEGWALTQEKGREIITDKSGNIKSLGSDGGAKYTYLKQGDKVLNADKTMEYMRLNQMIGKTIDNGTQKDNVIIPNFDFSEVVSAIKDKPETTFTFNNNKFQKFVKQGHSMKEVIENRIDGKGKRF